VATAVTDASVDGGLIVRVASRAALRSLRPVVRVVFIDVALDAEWRDGRLVAATSARLVADHVGLDAGTAAAALRVLREGGLVELGQATGPSGRFGLAEYTVHVPDGIEVIRLLRADRPHAARPHAGKPDAVTPSASGKRRAGPASRGGAQGALDLGLGTR
jgi:hypothetical protein